MLRQLTNFWIRILLLSRINPTDPHLVLLKISLDVEHSGDCVSIVNAQNLGQVGLVVQAVQRGVIALY